MAKCRMIGFLFICLVGIFAGSSGYGDSPPNMPFTIRGNLFVNGTRITADNGAAYTVEVTREDRTHFEQSRASDLGTGYFILNVPVQQSGSSAEGMVPGETLLLHVYWAGYKLLLTVPAGGSVVGGRSGETFYQDIEAITGPGTPRFYSQEELDQAVADAVAQWDAGGDRRIGLEEAIHALRVVSGY